MGPAAHPAAPGLCLGLSSWKPAAPADSDTAGRGAGREAGREAAAGSRARQRAAAATRGGAWGGAGRKGNAGGEAETAGRSRGPGAGDGTSLGGCGRTGTAGMRGDAGRGTWTGPAAAGVMEAEGGATAGATATPTRWRAAADERRLFTTATRTSSSSPWTEGRRRVSRHAPAPRRFAGPRLDARLRLRRSRPYDQCRRGRSRVPSVARLVASHVGSGK
jgi:hypothetical protein